MKSAITFNFPPRNSSADELCEGKLTKLHHSVQGKGWELLCSTRRFGQGELDLSPLAVLKWGEMSESGPLSAPAGYDALAVVDLSDQTIVRINDPASAMLRLDVHDLPVELAATVMTTDLALLTERALPKLRSGQLWSGGLRFTKRPSNNSPLAAIFVPHISIGSGPPRFASLLFASVNPADAQTMAHDSLTGLPTRSALFDRLESAVRRNRTSPSLLVALFVDLDGLKNINDRYGHEVGDTALIETAQRITARIPEQALAVRFGGDEFVIVFEDAPDLDYAETVADNILSALSTVGDYHAISASIGVAVSRSGEVDGQELIRRADSAMYRAKARGGSQVAIFDAEMRTQQRSDEALRASLLDAIANNGFVIAAQPIFQLATGMVRGVELFTRVRDDTPYIANANQLFRLAHEYGEAFDAAVLGRALALARVWKQSFGIEAPRVHINVSAQSLAASQFVSRVADALADSALSGSSIAFEVDGRDLATAGERERDTIDGLRELGTPLIVDGFGDGSLALTDLAVWQPSMVKLAAEAFSFEVLTGLIRGVSTLSILTCVKGIGAQSELQQAVAIGTYCGQGNALAPVSSIDRINAQLRGPQRIGF